MNENSCITKCYKKSIHDQYFIHPFLSIYDIIGNSSYCIPKFYTNKDSFRMNCNNSTKTDINIENTLNVPLHPTSYLYLYYNFNNISDVIRYLRNNVNINIYTISRIIDFALITYKDTFDDDIDKWIEIIRIIYDKSIITDEVIIKGLKKIFKKEEPNELSYPYNFIDKFAKII